ncbi:S41 family peptidase [Herbidospora mongoliensis]|uniref:S41 family peptidase n=1 Tax=Herbidospora mongoliensis TaxID=688067 RepID=UPI000831716E|nr:S41 family peptidase [Herbidospora mongoliensis]
MRAVAAGLVVLLATVTACSTPEPPRSAGGSPEKSACARPAGPPGDETPTTIDVIEQAYFCILGNSFSGAKLDAGTLLAAGFTALTRELNRAGRDDPAAVMPPLTGDRTADWAAFETVYRKVAGPDEALAVATLQAMVASLGDNHARWSPGQERPPGYYDGDGYGLGLQANARGTEALPPLFVTEVPGGAARKAGVRPGDIIESVNGSAPFVDGEPTPAIAALYPQYPEARPVEVGLRREDRRWTVTLEPGLYQRDLPSLQVVQSRLLADDIAYVRVRGFAPDAANRVFRAVSRLRTGRTLTGIVLDLRGNGGGSPVEATRLVSAFAHGKATAYMCNADDNCEAATTDDTVELLGLPLVVLVDRGCASACEHFSSAVKDLRLGTLVGTRTAGMISGPAQPFLLRNNTILSFPTRHHLGPNREVIDRIGVPPDQYVPPTPEDAAAGRDPALARALTLLDG